MQAPRDGSRIAIVEIGTNSTKLVVARVTSGVLSYRIVRFSKRTTRIGRGLETSGRLSTVGLEQTIDAIRAFAHTLPRGMHRFAFSTYAMRRASTARDVARLEKALGCPLKILTGRQEARFAYQSARHSLRLDLYSTVLVDIGGGSTEIVLADGGRVRAARSLPVGALHLTERFLTSDPIAQDELARMVVHVRATIERALRVMSIDRRRPGEFDLAASGGTVTTLANIIAPGGKGNATSVRSIEVSRCLDRLVRTPLRMRKRIAGLAADRADIMPAGVVIVRELLRATGKRVLRVNPGGVREGVLLHIIGNGLRW